MGENFILKMKGIAYCVVRSGRFLRTTHYALFFVILSGLFFVGCGGAGSGDIATEVTEMLPTLAVTAVPVTIPPTKTDIPQTETPPPTATPLPTATMSPELVETAVPTATPIDRSCPAASPEKPDYERNVVAADRLPTPNPALLEPHFWLVKPLPDEQLLALNLTYPYGSDGNGRYLLHNGLDSLADKGVDVLAAGAGTVAYAGEDADVLYGWRCDWYGNLVVIEHDELWQGQPVYSLYGHVLDVFVEMGQRVEAGDRVAEVGFGGVATHPHLHFEVRVGRNEFSATRNPLLWLAPETGRGVIVGRLVDGEKRPWQGTRVTLIDGSSEEVEFIDTWTYLDDPEHLINPDEDYAENFVFGDLAAGNYELFAKIQGIEYRQSVAVKDGELSFVEIVTEPFMTPTREVED
ncbi:MAG: M23 family metallopeptidase [Anaerolineae bacterium]|nr:M23 family metallopeptidase [Anaerolineae bacterium]